MARNETALPRRFGIADVTLSAIDANRFLEKAAATPARIAVLALLRADGADVILSFLR
jgi:hypothetical protein